MNDSNGGEAENEVEKGERAREKEKIEKEIVVPRANGCNRERER